MTYTGAYDEQVLRHRFRHCCQADPQAFLDLSLFNAVPGMEGHPADPVNACKFLLYQDPLIQLSLRHGGALQRPGGKICPVREGKTVIRAAV